MITNLDGQKQNISQFHFTASHTITELYRADSYVEQLKSILRNLNNLITLHDRMVKNNPLEIRKTKVYANLVNNIAVEMQYLKATNEAMEDNLDEIKRTELIQHRISGKMLDLKRQVNRMIEKSEKILEE